MIDQREDGWSKELTLATVLMAIAFCVNAMPHRGTKPGHDDLLIILHMTLKDRSYFSGTKSNLKDFPCQLETVVANCSFDDSDITLKSKAFRSLFSNEFSPG